MWVISINSFVHMNTESEEKGQGFGTEGIVVSICSIDQSGLSGILLDFFLISREI